MTLGITGTDGAGKGTVVSYLVQVKGFVHYSGRELLTAVLKDRGIGPTRPNLRLLGNEFREAFGDDYLVVEQLRRARAAGHTDIIIESIRATAEAQTLKRNGGILLALDADPHVRYERIVGRDSETDKISFEEFIAAEALEMNDTDPHGMQKAAVMTMADHTIYNEGDLDRLYRDVDEFLALYAE